MDTYLETSCTTVFETEEIFSNEIMRDLRTKTKILSKIFWRGIILGCSFNS